MKKLFLSSNFYQVSNLLLPLLPKEPNKLTVTFIPTAADPYEDRSWMYEDRNKLIEMGFAVFDLDIKNKSKKQLFELTKDTDIIFVSGGNTYYLLEHVQKSGFDEVVKQLITNETIYIGSSAGSVLACPTIEYIEDLDDKAKAHLISFDGLGIIEFLLLPHYGDPKYDDKFRKIIDKWKNLGYTIKTLTNNQTIICNNNEVKTVSV